VREKLAHFALEANPQGPQALQKQIQQDAKRWSKLIKDNGIQAE
jgi:tripartite-type tricarboxylate transporter receptor subunit TctC